MHQYCHLAKGCWRLAQGPAQEPKVERPPGNGEPCPRQLLGSSRETFEVNHSVPALWSLGVHGGSPTVWEAGRNEEGEAQVEPGQMCLPCCWR